MFLGVGGNVLFQKLGFRVQEGFTENFQEIEKNPPYFLGVFCLSFCLSQEGSISGNSIQTKNGHFLSQPTCV